MEIEKEYVHNTKKYDVEFEEGDELYRDEDVEEALVEAVQQERRRILNKIEEINELCKEIDSYRDHDCFNAKGTPKDVCSMCSTYRQLVQIRDELELEEEVNLSG